MGHVAGNIRFLGDERLHLHLLSAPSRPDLRRSEHANLATRRRCRVGAIKRLRVRAENAVQSYFPILGTHTHTVDCLSRRPCPSCVCATQLQPRGGRGQRGATSRPEPGCAQNWPRLGGSKLLLIDRIQRTATPHQILGRWIAAWDEENPDSAEYMHPVPARAGAPPRYRPLSPPPDLLASPQVPAPNLVPHPRDPSPAGQTSLAFLYNALRLPCRLSRANATVL